MFKRNNVFSMIFPYVIGVLIGAGVALLMAPQSGQDTRNLLLNKGTEVKDRAVGTVGDTRERASRALDEVTHQAKESLSSLRNRGEEMIDEQKSLVEEGKKSAKQAAKG
jgi:gas vesicle protein